MCTTPMAVHMSGLYSSTAVVVVMQYAHYGVWSLPKRVSGLVQMDTGYHIHGCIYMIQMFLNESRSLCICSVCI